MSDAHDPQFLQYCIRFANCQPHPHFLKITSQSGFATVLFLNGKVLVLVSFHILATPPVRYLFRFINEPRRCFLVQIKRPRCDATERPSGCDCGGLNMHRLLLYKTKDKPPQWPVTGAVPTKVHPLYPLKHFRLVFYSTNITRRGNVVPWRAKTDSNCTPCSDSAADWEKLLVIYWLTCTVWQELATGNTEQFVSTVTPRLLICRHCSAFRLTVIVSKHS